MNDVILDGITFNNRTKFLGINLRAIDFTLASLLQDLAIGQQRIEHLEQRSAAFATFLKWTCDYGRSFRRFALCSIGVISVFGLIYYFIPNIINSQEFLDCLYFSALTFLRIGNADIRFISGIGNYLLWSKWLSGYGIYYARTISRYLFETDDRKLAPQSHGLKQSLAGML